MFNWYKKPDSEPEPKEELKAESKPTAPPTPYLLQFFTYEHLSPSLQPVSKPFCELAYELSRMLPFNPELNYALRKLLEAKDCAVRAAVMGLPKED